MLGVGVMIANLSGDKDSVEIFLAAIGKTITELTIGEDDAFHLVFSDGSKMRLVDTGQSCCETRYMRTDDTLSDYIGAQLLSVGTREVSSPEDEGWDAHDIEFLVVKTSKGDFTMSNHNVHNGYYGGFAIRAEKE